MGWWILDGIGAQLKVLPGEVGPPQAVQGPEGGVA